MRLIDADALTAVLDAEEITFPMLDDAPTVDAVPVEFIEKSMNEWCKYGYEDDAEALFILIHNWHMETAEREEE